jgi:hypothetical protein
MLKLIPIVTVLKPTQNNAFQKLEMADGDDVRLNFFLKTL